jgi:SAM-dependent methyltransferase
VAISGRLIASLKRTWLDPFHISHSSLERELRRHGAAILGCVLDVGCGEQPYRRLFPGAVRYYGVETNHTPARNSKHDVVAIGESLPFEGDVFDAVVCTEVLEHVPEPSRLLAEMHRVTAPGGAVLLSTPMTWGLHEEPNDFYRYTKYGLRYLFNKAGLQVVSVRETTGTLGMVGQRLASFLYYTLGGRRLLLKPFAIIVAAIIQLCFAAGDALFGRRGDTLDWVVLARKPR